MTKAELKELIEEKKNELYKYESINYFNIKFLTLISIICFIVCIAVGIVMIAFLYNLNNAIFMTASTFSFVFAGIILVFYILALIIYIVKKTSSPKAIEKLEKEIEILEKELDK